VGTNTIAIESVDLSSAVTDAEAVIGDMIKELAHANPEMAIEWNPDERVGAGGVDLAALKNKLIEENPRGADWSLQFYQRGDRFAQTRAMNEDIDLIVSVAKVSREAASDIREAWDTAFKNFGLDTHEMIGRMGLTDEAGLRTLAAERPEGIEAQIAQRLDQGKIAAQGSGQAPAGGMVVIRQGENGGTDRILSGREALGEAFDRLRAVTVMTEHANPSTLHHEWLHFMTNVVIPNSPRYRTLLEEAAGKKLEAFTPRDHEWLAEQYEKYLRSGEAPTPGLRALFKRIAEALRQFVRSGNVSPQLREFFDRMLAGPDAAMVGGEDRQGQSSRARVETDNEQQRAFAEMTGTERILQSDVHTREEKAEILFAMERAVVDALINMEAIPVPAGDVTKATAKVTYSQIKQRKNKQTGQQTVFVNRAFGKIRHHRGFDLRVIPILAEAFENAVHMYDEPVNTAYKEHNNFTGYSHYAAKIQIDKQPIFARFKLENLKTKPGKEPVSQFHSVHLSYEVKNNAAEPRVNSSIINLATWGASGTTDLKLQRWLNFVKPNSENPILFLREKQREKINHVLNADPITVDASAIPFNGDIKQLKRDAFNYGKKLLGSYTNKSDNITFELTTRNKHGGLIEVMSHDHYDQYHLQSIAAIPAIATEAQFITSKANEDPQKHPGIREFRYYLSKIAFDQGEGKGNKEFIVKSVVSLAEDGKRYYDHRLTELEKVKGFVSSPVMQQQTGLETNPKVKGPVSSPSMQQQAGLETSPYNINDYRLRQILQEAFSENPMLLQLAYHGSPHRFDRFDGSRMGSGEGSQAYGWGHYFASRKEIAEWYRINLNFHPGAEIYVDDVKAHVVDDNDLIGDELYFNAYHAALIGELDNRIQEFEKEYAAAVREDDYNQMLYWGRPLQRAKELKGKKVELQSGQLYEVDIPGDEEMLDFDKKLNKQPEQTKKAIEKILVWNTDQYGNTSKILSHDVYTIQRFNDGYGFQNKIIQGRWGSLAEAQNAGKEYLLNNYSGALLYNVLSADLGSDEAASKYLNSLGIKGIRYLDGSSRAAGEGSYNYVVFDDSDIEITDMLFQMTREDIHAEALRHASWRAWMEAEIFAETQGWDKAYRRDDGTLEPQAQQEIEAWYEKQWNEAQVLAREAVLGDDGIRTPANAEKVDPSLLDGEDESGSLDWDPELYEAETAAAAATAQHEDAGKPDGKPITTSEANRRLAAKLPQVIDDFLLVIGQTMRTGLEHYGAVTAEDAAARDQIERDEERIYREAHPYVRGLALRLSTGKRMNDTQRRAAISHMRRGLESGATVYRELYASLTEDPEFVSYAENEIQFQGTDRQRRRREIRRTPCYWWTILVHDTLTRA